MNEVIITDWSAPVHCPYCGVALEPNGSAACDHVLYIISSGNFVERSARFDQSLGVAQGSCWPEFSREEIERLGRPYDAASRVRLSFTDNMEFEIRGVTDSAYVGYAR